MTPRATRAIAVVCLVASIVLWPVAHITDWIRSVVFVNELSLAAIVLACVIWVVASHLDVKRENEDIPQEVVEKIKDDPALPGH